jgi:uncharacterized protein (TIGR03437 family)
MRFLILFAILAPTAHCADFTTYIAGPSLGQSVSVAQIATDSAGNTYVTGTNAFVTKLDPAGDVVFTISIGPPGSYATCIAMDPTGNVWVGGQTLAATLPLVNALQSSPSIPEAGFLVKMAPDGTVLYSSYFGGLLGASGVNGIATDQSGNVYVTGFTDATDFPTTPGLPASPVSASDSVPMIYGVFATKLNATGQKILYSTLIAGPPNCAFCPPTSTMGIGIAVDGSGNALVAGDTTTSDLPVTATGGSGPAAFVFKINAAGNQLVYFTYVGSSVGNSTTPDAAPSRPIAADASGNAYVAGYTNSLGFVTKLSPAGTTVWTTSLSTLKPATANAISLDSSDNVWLTGGNFVAELSADGSAFLYTEPFPAGAAGQDIAVDRSGAVHFAGSIGLISTLTPTQPLAPRVLSIVNAASGELSGTVAPGEIISLYGLGMGPTVPVTATPANGVFPTSLFGVQVLVNGTPIPLLYVSASQINAEIPSGVASGGLTTGIALVQVTYALSEWTPLQQITFTQALPDFRLALVGSNFAVFENSGSMAVMNQDGTLNKMANPAKLGGFVTIWATGFGATGAPVDGAVAPGANNFCNTCQLTLSNRDTSVTETVQYAGSSPGLIDGLMQINFMIPTQFSGDLGAFVYFTPPGYLQPLLLGWVNVSP